MAWLRMASDRETPCPINFAGRTRTEAGDLIGREIDAAVIVRDVRQGRRCRGDGQAVIAQGAQGSRHRLLTFSRRRRQRQQDLEVGRETQVMSVLGAGAEDTD
jgi:hypothetical protein